jgi:hypothetical protein
MLGIRQLLQADRAGNRQWPIIGVAGFLMGTGEG